MTTPTIELQIRLFGAFRQFHTDPVALTIATGSTAQAIKVALGLELQRLSAGAFTETALLSQSVLATENSVLEDSTLLTEDTQLAILPPVCGG
jgi:molybdopterin converting factor small subunit